MTRLRTGSPGCDCQDLPPLLLVRDPRQLDQPRDQPPLLASEAADRRELPAPDGVGLTQALLNEVVIEQPDRDQPLLDRGVGQPGPRIDRYHVGAMAARPAGQLANEHRDMRPARPDRVDAFPLADLQILAQATGISIDRAGRPPQIGPDPQPPGRGVVAAQHGPFLLEYNGAQRCSSAAGETVPELTAREA